MRKAQKVHFQHNFRKAGLVSRFLYIYGNKLIDAVSKNKGVMTEKMIEDMNNHDGQDAMKLKTFQTRFNNRVANWRKKHPGREPSDKDWYVFTRGAFLTTFWWDIGAATLSVTIAESIAVFYTWYIG